MTGAAAPELMSWVWPGRMVSRPPGGATVGRLAALRGNGGLLSPVIIKAGMVMAASSPAAARPPLEWRDVLVAAKDIVRVVPSLQRPQALEGFIAKRGAHALDGLVGLHVVHVAAADRPRLEGRRGGARPLDGLLVEGSVQPGGHHADVECSIAEAEGRASPVDVLRRAVKRLDQHLPGRSPQRHHSFEQLVDQLIRQLADEVALPVVAIHAVAGVEHML